MPPENPQLLGFSAGYRFEAQKLAFVSSGFARSGQECKNHVKTTAAVAAIAFL
jgi:hypothetical protein